MQHQTEIISGSKGVSLFTQRWLPDSDAKGILIISHGIAEHSGRYAYAAEHFVNASYAVYALDHRGHGRSGGLKVHVDSFSDYVTDLRIFAEHVRTSTPALPTFVFGHSMGSLIALLYSFEYGDELSGLITTGTALKMNGINSLTHGLIDLFSFFLPKAPLVPPIQLKKLSRDPKTLSDNMKDNLVYHGFFRVRQISELLRAAKACIDQLPLLEVDYLALHGGDDSLANPVAIEIIESRSGAKDTTTKIYEGLFHELVNEPEKDQVLADMVGWIDSHLTS